MPLKARKVMKRVAVTTLTVGMMVAASEAFKAQASFGVQGCTQTCNYLFTDNQCGTLNTGCTSCNLHIFTSSMCGPN
jgi:hypothetical protein